MTATMTLLSNLLKKAIFKAAPFAIPKDQAEIHLCKKFEFNFFSKSFQ